MELGGTHGWRWAHEMMIMMMVIMIEHSCLKKKKEKNKMVSRQR
jgi:predicted ferric reductase